MRRFVSGEWTWGSKNSKRASFYHDTYQDNPITARKTRPFRAPSRPIVLGTRPHAPPPNCFPCVKCAGCAGLEAGKTELSYGAACGVFELTFNPIVGHVSTGWPIDITFSSVVFPLFSKPTRTTSMFLL